MALLNIRQRITLASLTCICVAHIILTGCSHSIHEEHPLPDTLVVGTLYSPTGFFILKDDTLGYDYDRICNFARSRHIAIKFKVAPHMAQLLQWLEEDSVQLLAAEIPLTAEYKRRILPCGAINETHQVLVQPKSDSLMTDVTQLVGKEIWVEKGSKYDSRLRNLNNEIGGGITIRHIVSDTIATEELIAMVSEGKIPLTVVDSDIAMLNHTYYNNIDISLPISFAQRQSWAVSHTNEWLADSINQWAASSNARNYSKSALRRYFEISRSGILHDTAAVAPVTPPGCISPYDSLFRHYSRLIHWDWRLLAAMCYTESHFDPNAVSWAGARGIMQLMPSTAAAYGLSPEQLTQPEPSIRVAVQSIKDVDALLRPYIGNPSERIRFTLAAYNAGIGHVIDAIALARKHERCDTLWYGHVEETILWKQSPQYYNDPVCRFGYFRGRQTVAYVAEVEQHYLYFCNHHEK
ncbi:MAG: transglycosylase SLT domain-containing protein [Muribaculaceae bacterium]|nr:transglycosylase SLT domain-containing protein [Muribaculaceae bacterium]